MQLCLYPGLFGRANHEFKPLYSLPLLGSLFPAGTLPPLTFSLEGCSQGWEGKQGPVTASWELGQCQLRSKRSKGRQKNPIPGSPGLSTCPRHVPPQRVNARISSALRGNVKVSCGVPAHPACTWTSRQPALPAGMPSCLTPGTKCSPSNTRALGCHGRGCQLAGHPLLVTGGTLSLNHPGHPYSVHLAPCPPHLSLPLS